MKKILFSMMTLVLVIGLVGAGAFAVFSDVETSEDNTFTAGTLDLAPTSDFVEGSYSGAATNYKVWPGGDGINGKVEFGTVDGSVVDGIKPGDSGTITWNLTNTGSVDGLLTLTSATTFTGESINEPECVAESGTWTSGSCSVSDDTGDLDTYLLVWLERTNPDASKTNVYGLTGTYEAMSGLAAAINGETNLDMDASKTYTYVLSWKIESDVGGGVVDDNIIQSDKAELDITFTLVQS